MSDPDVPEESSEQAAFRDKVRSFLADKATPKHESTPWIVNFHTDPDDARREFEEGRAWQRTRYEAGMAGFAYPTEYGGQGGEPWMDRIYAEEARRYGSSSGFVHATISMLGPTLMSFGTEEQKRTLLPRLLSAEDAWCQLFSEPGSGSDLASLGCRAIRDGDEFVINGQKVWNSAAQWCDHGFLLVRTNPDVPKHRGITMVLIRMNTPGVDVRPLVQATGASHFNEVFLNDVRVPVSNVLGEIDGGWAAARAVLSNEAAMIGGNTAKTFPLLLRVAESFGRRTDPVARQGLADFYAREAILDVMAQRLLASFRQPQGTPIDPSLLKLYMTDKRIRSSNLSAALSGPSGMIAVDEMTRWVSSEIVGRYSVSIGGGTTEVQKNNLAERALGLPREPSEDRTKPWRDLLRN